MIDGHPKQPKNYWLMDGTLVQAGVALRTEYAKSFRTYFSLVSDLVTEIFRTQPQDKRH